MAWEGCWSFTMNTIITLYKPSGITSHQAVGKVKRLFSEKKAGHTGTLDPLATGVLLVCLGEATKVSRFLLDMDKRYCARVKLGERTDTLDADGTVVERRGVSFVTDEAIIRVAEGFVGRIKQKPPMYSAVKINGQTLHKLARKGIEVDRPARSVEIYEVRVLDVEMPFFTLDVSCSKGTYIRSLCDDIGQGLGTGAHLVSLERTGIGIFDVRDAVTFEELEACTIAPQKKACHGINEALTDLDELVLEDEDCLKAKNGVAVRLGKPHNFPPGAFIRLKNSSGAIFGIGRSDDGSVRIERILNL